MTLSLASAFAGLAAALPRRRTVVTPVTAPVAQRPRPVSDEAYAAYMDPSYETYRDYRPGWRSGDPGRSF